METESPITLWELMTGIAPVITATGNLVFVYWILSGQLVWKKNRK